MIEGGSRRLSRWRWGSDGEDDQVKDPAVRVYSADEASEVALGVVDYDPDEPREFSYVPEDPAAASAGVQELARLLDTVFRSIRRSLKGASDGAGLLSDDRLQGIAELIQNADDLGAKHVHISVDEAGSRLLFGHDGAGLTLHDVWALAIPWLSLKTSEEEKLGRFGIGLKTLHSLSSVLEVSEGHFDVRFDSGSFEPIETPISWPGHPEVATGTRFAVPFAADTVSTHEVADWLAAWGEAGMVFLRSLSTITLIDSTGSSVAELHLDQGGETTLDLAAGPTLRRSVATSDGRRWLVYLRRPPTPEGVTRSGKATGSTTSVALALPQFDGERGHIHVGLPIRKIGLPFRVLAQFDPQTSRRDLADTDWNLALVPLIAELWLDAALDVFDTRPSRGWATVPLATEFATDERTAGRLRDALQTHLMDSARRAFAEAITLDGGEGRLPLTDLAYEAPELTRVLSPIDVQHVSTRKGAIAEHARSSNRRWREVLDDLSRQDMDVPYLVEVKDALELLSEDDRSPEFVADLVGVAVEAGESDVLSGHRCLVLDDGSRAVPGERGLLEVLLPRDADALWGTLGMGSHLHSAFTESDAWSGIHDWLLTAKLLRSDASERAALIVLSGAGEEGERLATPLTDAQLDAVGRSFEPLDDAARQRLGPGVGRAILLDGTTYDTSGERVAVHVSPAEAYLIERDQRVWSIAAGRTPGLTWLHRRYMTRLRRSEESMGAQRLFRILGAESAPRIVEHPLNRARYVATKHGIPSSVATSPQRRNRLLAEHQATYTVADWSAPDLDAVLANIAAETDPDQRRRRALAVLGTLNRAWDRLDGRSTVMAAAENYGWVDKGRVEAWWLSKAASTTWLTSESGKPSTPDELSIRSAVNVMFHGDDPDLYLDQALDVEAYHGILARIGVAGDPTVGQLIQKLEEIRDATLSDPAAAQEQAAPFYQTLAGEVVRGSRLGQLTAQTARSRFGRGTGLIATSAGWRRPSVVFAGPPRFGDMRRFVPAVSEAERLWRLLGISEPTASDALSVLTELSRTGRTDKMVMLEALRLLAASPPNPTDRKRTLRRSAVWVGDRWTTKRPVYAVANPVIADNLKTLLPVWDPGGAISQFEPLIEPYGLTRLDTPNGQVLSADLGRYDADLSQVFARAVRNLRTDLSTSDPLAEKTLSMSWETLAAFRVAVLPDLKVRLAEATHGTDVTVSLDAWLDMQDETLYVAEEDAVGKPGAGGYAVASAFGGDARRISHDWGASWSAAHDGYQAELITTATRLAAEQERNLANDDRLKALAERSKAKRQEQKGKLKNKNSAEPSATPAAASKPPRLLVDPANLVLHDESGEMLGGAPKQSVSPEERGERSPGRKPKMPRPEDPRKPQSGGRAPRNYTEEERESVGLDLVRRVLGGDNEDVIDIRHQHNVGADAIDKLDNFYELKVHSGAIPDSISLTRDEYLRARETEAFFLVVVGNVERSDANAEIRIITDPLSQLEMKPSGSVTLGGIRSAKALRYTFGTLDAETDDRHNESQ